MSDRMRLIPFDKMLSWVLSELKEKNSIFGIHRSKFYKNNSGSYTELFGEKLATPLGPAAGPNSQLTQNIVSAYLTGCRFIELKTVQKLDGEDLPVSKPCIYAQDECYNVEWSTELRVPDAYNEYIKAWFLLHVLMKELGLSEKRDFMFNMSVGYDLEGIKSPKMDAYIEGMRNAANTDIWKECREVLLSNLNMFSNFTKADLDMISPVVCPSITLSTLHGCPPQEIERIATYFLKEKNLHTFVKMNPTLLGERFVRDTLDAMGYEYITLNGHHFIHDLQFTDAVAMLKRLKALAGELKLEIGVKLTNTLPVKILNEELPGEEMYMSGRSLYALSISLAGMLAKEFNGDLHISYSGGIDFFNIDKVAEAGVRPITFATTILKPGGYERIKQMADKVEDMQKGASAGIDIVKIESLAKNALTDKHHLKELRPVNSRKLATELPLYDCAISPCERGCPINQQIPQYVALVGDGKYDEAFEVIVNDNASPAITGSICDHQCQYKCTRLDYDESVLIRDMKKTAALKAQDKYAANIRPAEIRSKKKAAIVGAGAAGLATALFLRRNGMEVVVMDKRERPYGVVEYVIPEFRISSDMVRKDLELVRKNGVEFKLGIDGNISIDALKKDYDYIVMSIGAGKPGQISLEKGSENTVNAISFLENYKAQKGNIKLGSDVCVIGGGNVAMDAARAAKRVSGVESVSIVYRRTRGFMPADNEEIQLAASEGVLIKELLSPVTFSEGKLVCEIMALGERDSSGRRSPVSTGKTVTLDADNVIVAVGEQIDSTLLSKNGIELDAKGFPKVGTSCETNIPGVYVAGDAKAGPATIVKAIADGKAVAKDILQKEGLKADFEKKVCFVDEKVLYERKGILNNPKYSDKEAERCLSCENICELCVDVCPNRANAVIFVEEGFASKHQIVHLDGMCNECGNCGIFCPHKGNPYKDKVTVFWSEEDFKDSTNKGFLVTDMAAGKCLVRTEGGETVSYAPGGNNISKEMEAIIRSCIDKYSYML